MRIIMDRIRQCHLQPRCRLSIALVHLSLEVDRLKDTIEIPCRRFPNHLLGMTIRQGFPTLCHLCLRVFRPNQHIHINRLLLGLCNHLHCLKRQSRLSLALRRQHLK